MPDPPQMIPIIRPLLGEEEAAAARRPILSGWVTQGPEGQAFEQEFADCVGAEHACAVSNCTAALHLALLAAGVGPGDEVITASHSFIATANSVRFCGALPVFADVQPGSFNIDPAAVEALITPRTRAVLAVHQIGLPCDLPALTRIAADHGLPLVEDAACAAGSEINWQGQWQRIGRPHGDIACFSFHPRKLLTLGDGGMITTRHPEWDARVRLLRQQGMSVPAADRHAAREVVFEGYPELGYNYRLTDIQAAVGRVQLQRLPGMVARRRQLVARYRELLSGAVARGVVLPEEPPWARSNWQSFCVRLPDGADQRAVMQALRQAGVASTRGVMCAHRQGAYTAPGSWSCGEGPGDCGCPPGTCQRLRQSELATDRCLILPLFHQMTDEQQQRVAAALEAALAMAE